MTREEAIESLNNLREIGSDEAIDMAIEALQAPTDGDIIRCKDCYWYDKGKNDCDSWEWCKRHKFDSYDEGFCSWATHKKQVTSKLKKPCDSLLTEDSEERKEQKSKLDLIRREDAIDAIDDAIDADSPQWAILRTKIGFLPSADRPTDEWCTDCKEYDHEKHCCPRFNRVIRTTLNEVVRCKDCQWQEECSQFVVLHKFHGVYQGISFCSHGERRDPTELPQYAEWKEPFEKMVESAKVGDDNE